MAFPIALGSQAVGALFDPLTLALKFTYSGGLQGLQAINRARIEPGCILWHENTNAMFIVDVVTADGTNWHVSATMVTNYWINQVGQYIPVVPVQMAGYLYLYQTFHKSTTYQYRGDTTGDPLNPPDPPASRVIKNVKRNDGYGGGVTSDFKVGDLVFNNDQFWDNHLPPGALVTAVAVDPNTGFGLIEISKPAKVTAVGVPIELYR